MRAVPPGGEFATLVTPDGAQLRYGLWPGDPTKPMIIFLPGFRESIEKHFETIDDLQQRGLTVFTLDWRGQGLSDRVLENREKVHIEDFATHAQDLRHFVDSIVSPRSDGPRFILAHSMGAHLALRYLHDEPEGVEGAFLASPMCDIWTPPGLRWLFTGIVWLMTALGQGHAYAFGRTDYGPRDSRFIGNRVSSDQDRYAEEHAQIAANPALRIGGPTWGWFRAAWQSVDLINRPVYLQAINTPVWMLQAGKDGVVANGAQDKAAANLGQGQLHLINGARHELLRESDVYRDQLWALFDRFIAECS